MAISLSIQKKGHPPETAVTVPIAGMSIFDRYWVPAVEALKLQWVPHVQDRLPGGERRMPFILDELKVLRASIARSGGEASEIVLPRLDRLIEELDDAGRDPDQDLYIG